MGISASKFYNHRHEPAGHASDDETTTDVMRDNESVVVTVFRHLSAKQYLVEKRYARLPTTLDIPAPNKMQRVSKMRRCTSSNAHVNICEAVRDFIQVLEGADVADGDIGVQTLFLSLDSDVSDMLNCCVDNYVQESFSMPLFLHNALARLDVVVGMLSKGNSENRHAFDERMVTGVFYVADVAFADVKALTCTEIFYLTDRALFFRNGDSSRWMKIAKLFCRLAAVHRSMQENIDVELHEDLLTEFVHVRKCIADEYARL